MQSSEETSTKPAPQEESKEPTGDHVLISNDLAQVQTMMQAHNLTKGLAPTANPLDQALQSVQAKEQQEVAKCRKLYIPSEIFADFKEVTVDNSAFFEYVAFYLTMQCLERLEEDKWIIEFPTTIPSMGRSILHEVATYFGLKSHSEGSKHRKTLVYPRSLYLDKQEKERAKLDKDLGKIRDKFQNKGEMVSINYDNPQTMRDKMIALVYLENRAEPNVPRMQKLRKEIFGGDEEVPTELEAYKAYVQPLVEAKKRELEQSEFAGSSQPNALDDMRSEVVDEGAPASTENVPNPQPKKAEVSKPSEKSAEIQKEAQPKQQQPVPGQAQTEPKATTPEESKDEEAEASASEEENIEEPEPTEEEIQAAIRAEQRRQEEAKKTREYHEKLATTTAENFVDRPDPIELVRVTRALENSLTIAWDRPSDNNEELVLYNIYVSDSPTPSGTDSLYQKEALPEDHAPSFRVPDLDTDSIFYVRVHAVNAQGEGYPPRQSTFVRTLDPSATEPSSLYVWGNNESSEIGLTDEMCQENRDVYAKCALPRPVRHPQFDGMVYSAAAGNVNSLYHCISQDDDGNPADSMVILSGIATMPKEGVEEVEQNEITEREVGLLQDVASLPFMVDFVKPVAKVVCGDLFSGILTCEGTVFTWGYNKYGQLGIKQQETLYVQRPKELEFLDKSPGSARRRIFIKDLACGYNHCMALSDSNQVFVWGRKTGIYPNIELNHHFLMANRPLMEYEIHQAEPRLLSNNLIFYKIEKLFTGPFNSALVSEQGQVLVQGDNKYGQLGLGPEVGPLCSFFPNFRKLDFFDENKLEVTEVSFTACSSHYLCREAESGRSRVFSIGSNEFGQLGNNSTISSHVPVEVTMPDGEEVTGITSGGFHTLMLTESNKVFGFGKKTKGQLGMSWAKGTPKFAGAPTRIPLPEELSIDGIFAGSLYSVAMVSDPLPPPSSDDMIDTTPQQTQQPAPQ